MFDEMWPGGPAFLKKGAFPIGTDSVLLAAFADKGAFRSVCDIGSGSGVVSQLLLWKDDRRTAVGIEIDDEAAETSRINAEKNGLSDRFSVIADDVRSYKQLGMSGAFDLTVSNPPYYPQGSGKMSSAHPTARGETDCTLADVCAAAAYFTRWGGRFVMVHKPERLAEAICLLSAAGLEPKRIRFTEYRAGAAPSLVLIDSRRGGKPGLVIEPPLIMTDGGGCDTIEICEIYHRQYLKRET